MFTCLILKKIVLSDEIIIINIKGQRYYVPLHAFIWSKNVRPG